MLKYIKLKNIVSENIVDRERERKRQRGGEKERQRKVHRFHDKGKIKKITHHSFYKNPPLCMLQHVVMNTTCFQKHIQCRLFQKKSKESEFVK